MQIMVSKGKKIVTITSHIITDGYNEYTASVLFQKIKIGI